MVNLLSRRLPFGGGEVEGILYDTEGLHLVYLLKCCGILSAQVKIIPYRLEITCLRTALCQPLLHLLPVWISSTSDCSIFTFVVCFSHYYLCRHYRMKYCYGNYFSKNTLRVSTVLLFTAYVTVHNSISSILVNQP